MNRWALGLHGLRFPLFMTACHMIFGSCALSPLMFLSPKYSDKHVGVLQNDWKGLTTIALMNGFQIACNNASLTVMELSMNQARACGWRPCALRPATTSPPACPRRPHRDARSAYALMRPRQVIRASVPVCVALFAVCIEHKAARPHHTCPYPCPCPCPCACP